MNNHTNPLPWTQVTSANKGEILAWIEAANRRHRAEQRELNKSLAGLSFGNDNARPKTPSEQREHDAIDAELDAVFAALTFEDESAPAAPDPIIAAFDDQQPGILTPIETQEETQEETPAAAPIKAPSELTEEELDRILGFPDDDHDVLAAMPASLAVVTVDDVRSGEVPNEASGKIPNPAAPAIAVEAASSPCADSSSGIEHEAVVAGPFSCTPTAPTDTPPARPSHVHTTIIRNVAYRRLTPKEKTTIYSRHVSENGNAMAWSLNLGFEVIKTAEANRSGFKSWMNDRLMKSMKAEFGEVRDFCFVPEFDRDGRLHLHGVVAANDNDVPKLLRALRKAGGAWQHSKGGDKHQAHVQPLRDDGWASYITADLRRTERYFGGDVISVTRGCRRRAEEAWETTRACS